MRQYHVKLHFHKQKGNYFAYDMWQWQDQVEGKSVSFSKLDYFGVEGNLRRTAKPRSCLGQRRGLAHQDP